MRIDEINLLGQFKITGNTGNNSQAIGMSGGSTSFIDVVASGGGSSEGLVKKSGYNYVIVEATGDDGTNGGNLLTAYSDAVTLLSQIGTPGIDNRVTILLTPGVYNLTSASLTINSYIDIVGISQNPLDTVINYGDVTFRVNTPGVDFGLFNIYLKSDIGSGLLFYDNGAGNPYLRMKNIVISGDGFYDPLIPRYGIYDLDGEFEDITVLDGCYFAIAENSMSGTYKNIEIGDVTWAFYAHDLSTTGTYKNITISNITDAFYSGSISGLYENIRFGCNSGSSSIFNNIVGGTFKNIFFTGTHGNIFGVSTGVFEDIEISNVSSAFTGNIDGTFKNIKIGDVTGGSVAVFSGYGNVYGTFSNIEIGNVTTDAFYGGGTMSGFFKDIKIGNGGSAFTTNTGNVTGTYENITIGDVTGGCFLTNNISGTFDIIKVGNVGDKFFYSTDEISGTFKNIKAGDVVGDVFSSTNLISGTYKNISVNSVSGFFSGVNINGTFDDISVFSNDSTSFYANSILFGTFSNIKIDSTDGNSFKSDDTLGGYYDGITIGTSLGSVFNSGASPVQGTFKNIKVTSCSGFFESGSTIVPTLVENIEVGEVTSGYFIYSAGSLDGTYKNIKVNSVAGNSFYGDTGMNGTYSNIEIKSCSGDVFSVAGGSYINVNVDKLTVGTASGAFVGNYAGSSFPKINRSNITAIFVGWITHGQKFEGILTNSTINMIGRNDLIFLSGSIIERCKILSDSGSNLTGSGQVIYNLANQPITVTGATQNISDTSITS